MKRISLFAVSALAFIAIPEDAHAYIDPGSGSYFLQIVLLAFFSSIAFIKTFWHNIKQRVTSLFKGDKS